MRIGKYILRAAAPVVADICLVVEALEDDLFLRVGVRLIRDERTGVVGVGPLGKTYVRAIVTRQALDQEVHIKIAARSLEITAIADAVAGAIDRTVEIGIVKPPTRRRANDLKVGNRLLIKPEPPVKTAHIVMSVDKIVGRAKKPEKVLFTDVAF